MLLRRLLPLAVRRATARAPRPALPAWTRRRLSEAAAFDPPPPPPPLLPPPPPPPERAGHIAALLASAQPDLALAGARVVRGVARAGCQ
jgi:hypothetical protein